MEGVNVAERGDLAGFGKPVRSGFWLDLVHLVECVILMQEHLFCLDEEAGIRDSYFA